MAALTNKSLSATSAPAAAAAAATAPADAKVSWADLSEESAGDDVYRSEATFESLGLKPQIYQNVLCELKYVTPSKIQAESLPIVLSDKRPNFIGQSKAGSGKTAAYGLAVMNRVDPSLKTPQAIILVPVRELAIQVYDQVLSKLAKNTGLTVKKAIPEESKGVVTDQVVVGTPGTVLAKLKSKEIDGKQIQIFVCDEADRMIAMNGGLGDQTLNIKRLCTHKQLQVLLFSATFPPSVSKFAEVIAPQAKSIRITKEQVSLGNVKQFWVSTQPGDTKEKYDKLVMLNALMNMGQSLIFVETVKTAKELTNQLRTDGYSVSVLYGKDLKPAERDAVMRDFVSGKTTVLIATNVASRGIDVPAVNFVVNYELPTTHHHHQQQGCKPDFETYAHRVGRAGRFGRVGAAINFASTEEEKQLVSQIQKFFNQTITQLSFDDFTHLESTIKQQLQVK